MELPLRHHDARGVSLALIALPAASLLRGTHPAHAARRARAPVASTPHAAGHHSHAAHLPVAALSGLAHGRPCPPLGGLAHGPANHKHKPACGRLERPCTRAPVNPAGGPCTRADDERRRKDAACPHGNKAEDADRWGKRKLGCRPGNGAPLRARAASFFLPCERGLNSHTVVVTRPRLSLAL